MSFAVAGEAYDRFMGRYSTPLASVFLDFARVGSAGAVLDVGCGPGALTAQLVDRRGPAGVVAVDPSASFVSAIGERLPEVTVHQASAEQLPFESGRFTAALAQLVVHFMSDPVAGIAEMGRVTRAGGVVAACVWDHAQGGGPLQLFWEAVRDLQAAAPTEDRMPGTREGDLGEIFRQAGLGDIEEQAVAVRVEHQTFEDWWEPFTLGVGPAGAHVVALDSDGVERLRERCRSKIGEAPFEIEARAWAARGVAPESG